MRAAWVAVVAGLATLLVAALAPLDGASAASRGRAFGAQTARAVAAYASRDPEVARLLRTCPAETYKTLRTAPGAPVITEKVNEWTCAAAPWFCYRACVTSADGESCFSLARVYQLHKPFFTKLDPERMFAAACATGYRGGCTNRGAGIRNAGAPGDPFEGVTKADKETCEFRTFRIACREGDAWGCAMLGQAYHHGEGTAADPVEARRAYQRSCDLSPAFDACTFSKYGLDDLPPQTTPGTAPDHPP